MYLFYSSSFDIITEETKKKNDKFMVKKLFVDLNLFKNHIKSYFLYSYYSKI